jgi:predicted RNA-binding protein with PIN domain
MPLQYIIDGYNIINHPSFTNSRKKIKDPRLALLELIKHKRLCGSSKNRITVVFDGYPKYTGEKIDTAGINVTDIDVIFSRQETADARINKIAQNSGDFKNTVVVSDDKEIRYFVKSIGAKVIGVEEFINPLNLSQARAKRKGRLKEEEDLAKLELTYSQRHKINEELRKIWLKE